MIGARRAGILVGSALAFLCVATAGAELPVSLRLGAKEITKEEAVRSLQESGSVLMLSRDAPGFLPRDPSLDEGSSSGEFAPVHGSGTPPGARRPEADRARIHERGVGAVRDTKGRHDQRWRPHTTATGERKKHGAQHEEMEGHAGGMGEMPGRMTGDIHRERSRMHETGMMGGPAGQMMGTRGAEGVESMMGPGSGMRGGGTVPEMHHRDGMMGESAHEGMMGGGGPGGAGTGGMHGGNETPGAGGRPGGHGTGGMKGGGG